MRFQYLTTKCNPVEVGTKFMKEKILGWLGLQEEDSQESHIEPNRAAAALMVEIMAIDNEWADEEETQILSLLENSLGLTARDAIELLNRVKEDHQSSVDLYRYTSVINTHYDVAAKRELLEQLWKVAYADGQIDRYEEHMLRKLADLLHLPHSQYIQAKMAVKSGTSG